MAPAVADGPLPLGDVAAIVVIGFTVGYGLASLEEAAEEEPPAQ